jgi:hypothetical protein
VPERGLYNRYSKDGTSDIWSGYTYLRVHQWQNPELYWRYSPIAYVQNMRTPLLILHSEEDLRCQPAAPRRWPSYLDSPHHFSPRLLRRPAEQPVALGLYHRPYNAFCRPAGYTCQGIDKPTLRG